MPYHAEKQISLYKKNENSHYTDKKVISSLHGKSHCNEDKKSQIKIFFI